MKYSDILSKNKIVYYRIKFVALQLNVIYNLLTILPSSARLYVSFAWC